MSTSSNKGRVLLTIALLIATAGAASAADWPSWRGRQGTGEASAEGLISEWTPGGDGMIWRQDFIGRSTPVVMNGRVFINGRAGEGVSQRAVIAAFDAKDGRKLWENSYPLYLTTVPFNRVGWASLAGDPESGYLYAQLVSGDFYCIDADGKTVWNHSFKEEYGRFEGYGGRTASAIIDEDQVVVNMVNGAWGPLGPPRHRFYGFDKRNGDLLWISTPGSDDPEDRNTQSDLVLAVIDGQRLIIGGGSDGWVYAIQARTGKMVWKFYLSKRGINVSPVVDGYRVIIGHSEENVDEGTLGRVIAIDGRGSGDITKTNELWRRNEHRVGFPSPAVHDGIVYMVDNSANMTALDVETGKEIWSQSLGTVGKGSPVIADGKIYVSETNGRLLILEAGRDGGKILDSDDLTMPDGRYAEFYGSPAVAYGRIYFVTEEGLYCIGDPEAQFVAEAGPPRQLAAEKPAQGAAATLLVVPAEVVLRPGEEQSFELRTFSSNGVAMGNTQGKVDPGSLTAAATGLTLKIADDAGFEAAELAVEGGGLSAKTRVRVFPQLPWKNDFSGGKQPGWIGSGRYAAEELDGDAVLVKPVAERGLLRSNLLIGPPDLSHYTVQVDVRGSQKGRRRSDGGVINSGYTLDLLGIHQRLQLRSWDAMLRIDETIDFSWELDKWYTMKLRVDVDDGVGHIKAKVWPRGGEEPEAWSIEAEDPHPVAAGSPGLQAYSAAPFYFDNLQVTRNP